MIRMMRAPFLLSFLSALLLSGSITAYAESPVKAPAKADTPVEEEQLEAQPAESPVTSATPPAVPVVDPVKTPAAPSVPSPEAASAGQGAPAAPVHPEIRPTRILPSKIKPVQSTEGEDGLSKAAPEIKTGAPEGASKSLNALTLPPIDDGFALSSDWSDLDSGEIVEKLEKLAQAPDSATPEKKREIVDLLLVVKPSDEDEPAAELTKTDHTGEKNLDLYSYRLTKLLGYGEIAKVLELYKANEGLPPSSAAAEAGITAMLATGETGLACLENKALPDPVKAGNEAFWNHVTVLCNALLGSAAGDDDALRFANAARVYITATSPVVPSTAEGLNSLDPVTLLVLANNGSLSSLITNQADLSALHDLPLALLSAKYDSLSKELLRRGITYVAPRPAPPAAVPSQEKQPNTLKKKEK